MKHLTAKTFATAGAMLMALATTSHARAETPDVVDACIEHFIAKQLADHPGKITINKLPESTMSFGVTGRQVVQVLASTKSGTILSGATCVVSPRGRVVSIRFAHSRTVAKTMLAHEKKPEPVASKANES